MSSSRFIVSFGKLDARLARTLTPAFLRPSAPRFAKAATLPHGKSEAPTTPLEEVQAIDRSSFPWYARFNHPQGISFFFLIFVQLLCILWFNRERIGAYRAGRRLPFAQGGGSVPASAADKVSQIKGVMTSSSKNGQIIVSGAQSTRSDAIRSAAADARARYLVVTMPTTLQRTRGTEAADPMWLPKAFLVTMGYDPEHSVSTILGDSFLQRALISAGGSGVRPVLHVKVQAESTPEPFEAAVVFAAKMSRIATVVVDAPSDVVKAATGTVEDVLRCTDFLQVEV